MTDPKRALVVLLTAGLAVIVGCQPADATDEPKTTSSEVPGQAAPPAVDHAALDAVLRAHVDARGRVDYEAIARSSAELLGYTRSLADVRLESRPRDERLAILINAYNAFTLQLIVENWKGGTLESIRDLDDPWDQKRWRFGGKTVSLNHIEHEIIRKQFNEPRIHFALVCAAIGCPTLRAEAFVADRLEVQLDEQTRAVHQGRTWCRYDAAANTLFLTRLYDWYGSDFEKSAGSVLAFVARYVDGVRAALEEDRKPKIRWLDYDWALNKQ
ncbi:MAG: DUF547 domain-containing protein [Planctomycetota bacterium]|jgi:hypothetical protein